MDKTARYQRLQGLTVQLTQHLEYLRDALTDLSLSLKDSEMQCNPEMARTAALLTEQVLLKCAGLPSAPPPMHDR